jgi:hypothetical protein
MTEREHIEILRQLQEVFWRKAWADMKRSGVGREGLYHPPSDRDWLMMWCGT